MTHSLLELTRTDEALFVCHALNDPTIAPGIDAEFGSLVREQALEKAIPLAGKVIEAATPGADEAIEELTRRFVRHEVVVEDQAVDETLHGGGQVIFESPLHSSGDNQVGTMNLFTDREREAVFGAVKQTAMKPAREGEDLIALDFLAANSTGFESGVSQFILDTSKNHKRVRSVLTQVLLRLI